MNKGATEYKKALESLTQSVLSFENALDNEMSKPSTPERGQKVARLINFLTVKNQAAMHFTLGYSFQKIKKLYAERGRNRMSQKEALEKTLCHLKSMREAALKRSIARA